MKKAFLTFLQLSLCLLFFTNCKKKEPDPVAKFTIEKDTYAAGDNVTIKNSSAQADKCLWTFTGPDGAEIPYLPNFSYNAPPLKLGVFAKDGIYTLSLKVTNKAGKIATDTKTFSVKTTRATVYIYARYPTHGNAEIYADGAFIQYLTTVPVSFVAKITTSLPIGRRLISFSFYSNSNKKYMDVKEDGINEVHFDY